MGLARKSAPDVDTYRDADDDTTPAGEPDPDNDPDAGLSDEDENEDTPRSSSVAKRGFAAAKKAVADSGGDFGNEFKVPEDETLIKFIEDEPFASVMEHWVDEITKGKRSFYCLGDIGPKKDCPLCKVGHSPKAKVFFNVVEITGQEPLVTYLIAGPALFKKIEKEHEGKGGPIDRHYWRISKSGGGKKGPVVYSMSTVKARDLEDDYELDSAQVAASLKGLKPYSESLIKYPSKQILQDVVDEHLQDD